MLPLLTLGLFVFQLDRMNLASALTGGFLEDIKITQATVNMGNQLMFMGIVVFEIPCNMAQQRVRTIQPLNKQQALTVRITGWSAQVARGAGLRLRPHRDPAGLGPQPRRLYRHAPAARVCRGGLYPGGCLHLVDMVHEV